MGIWPQVYFGSILMALSPLEMEVNTRGSLSIAEIFESVEFTGKASQGHNGQIK